MSFPALKKKPDVEIATELEENLIEIEKKINRHLKKKPAGVYITEQKKKN
jgi:hypothetical protein